MKWCRVETPEGPSFGMVADESIVLVEGSPFGSVTPTGTTVPLAEA